MGQWGAWERPIKRPEEKRLDRNGCCVGVSTHFPKSTIHGFSMVRARGSGHPSHVKLGSLCALTGRCARLRSCTGLLPETKSRLVVWCSEVGQKLVPGIYGLNTAAAPCAIVPSEFVTWVGGRWITSNLETDGPHQLQSIALGDNAVS
jgi:hypothetical protein